jgi:hypothetical protein
MNNSSLPSPMQIENRSEFPLYSQILISCLAARECSAVVRDDFGPPVNNRAQDQADYRSMEERAYGLITLSLLKMPLVYQAVVQHQDVMPSAQFPYVRGSMAYRRLRVELLAADNVNVQFSHELAISNCKQAGRPPKVWALELNNLFALLPADQAYSDARKSVVLMTNCDKSLYPFLAGIAHGLTYSQLVGRLQSYVEASDNRNLGEEKAENIASVNVALSARIETLEAQLLDFKTHANSKARSGSGSSSGSYQSTRSGSSYRSKSGSSTKGRRAYQNYHRANKRVKFANDESNNSSRCWYCEDPGHFARDCPKKKQQGGSKQQQQQQQQQHKKKNRSKKSA